MKDKQREWLKRVANDDSFREIGEKAKLHYSGITRALGRNGLSAEQVLKIALAYDVPVEEALAETGWIPESKREPESPERIAETISYLAKKLAVQVHKPEPESNVHPFPTKNVGQDFYDAYSDQAVAYHDEELGGTPDDFDS